MDQCEKQLLLGLSSLSTWIKDDGGDCRIPVQPSDGFGADRKLSVRITFYVEYGHIFL